MLLAVGFFLAVFQSSAVAQAQFAGTYTGSFQSTRCKSGFLPEAGMVEFTIAPDGTISGSGETGVWRRHYGCWIRQPKGQDPRLWGAGGRRHPVRGERETSAPFRSREVQRNMQGRLVGYSAVRNSKPNHCSEPRAAMNVQTECEAVMASRKAERLPRGFGCPWSLSSVVGRSTGDD